MNKIEKIQMPYYLAYMCLISAKNENKKISCKCTFKVGEGDGSLVAKIQLHTEGYLIIIPYLC